MHYLCGSGLLGVDDVRQRVGAAVVARRLRATRLVRLGQVAIEHLRAVDEVHLALLAGARTAATAATAAVVEVGAVDVHVHVRRPHVVGARAGLVQQRVAGAVQVEGAGHVLQDGRLRQLARHLRRLVAVVHARHDERQALDDVVRNVANSHALVF